MVVTEVVSEHVAYILKAGFGRVISGARLQRPLDRGRVGPRGGVDKEKKRKAAGAVGKRTTKPRLSNPVEINFQLSSIYSIMERLLGTKE